MEQDPTRVAAKESASEHIRALRPKHFGAMYICIHIYMYTGGRIYHLEYISLRTTYMPASLGECMVLIPVYGYTSWGSNIKQAAAVAS